MGQDSNPVIALETKDDKIGILSHGAALHEETVVYSGQRRALVYLLSIDVCSATARALIALRELASQRSIAINPVP